MLSKKLGRSLLCRPLNLFARFVRNLLVQICGAKPLCVSSFAEKENILVSLPRRACDYNLNF